VRKSERFKFDVFKREIPKNEKPKARKKPGNLQDNDSDYYEEPLAHLNAPKAAKKSPRPSPVFKQVAADFANEPDQKIPAGELSKALNVSRNNEEAVPALSSSGLSPLQQAVVMAEILGPPKAIQ
jgi:hypothetical protein